MSITITKKDKSTGSQFSIATINVLDITLVGTNVNHQNISVAVPSATLSLTDDDENYIYVDWSTETLTKSTTGFPSYSLPLYKITTASGSITEIQDLRAVLRQSAHSEFYTLADYFLNQDYNVNQDWQELDLSSLIPVGTTTIWVRALVRDSGTPGDEVYFGMRKPGGGTEWSRMVKCLPVTSGIYAHYFWPVGVDADRKLEIMVKVSGTFTAKLALLGVAYGG